MTLMASAGKVFKSIFHGLFVFLLSSVTFIGIALLTVSLILTDKETVSSIPQRAGVYDNVTNSVITMAQGNPDEQRGGDEEGLNALFNSPTIETEAVKDTVRSVYTANYWQSKYETFIGDTYAWLEGEQEQLQFEIDFNDKTQELASALSTEIAIQLESLPTCRANQIPREFDVLSATCLPPGVSPSQAAQTVEGQLTGEDGLAGQDLRLSSEELDIDNETTTNMQNIYDFASALPLIVPGLIVLFVALVTLTGRTWLHGLRRAGLTLFSAGIISWIGWFVLNKITDGFSPDLGGNEAEQQIAQEIMQPLIQTATATVASTGMWVSLTVLITGALLWLGSYTWHKMHHQPETSSHANTSAALPANKDTLPEPVEPKS